VDVCCRCVAPQGLASAWALVRLLSSLPFGVEVHDPVVFLTAPLVLMAVALAAVHGPAARASRVDPIDSLRHE
jgi:ABC-type lipoprotein release transport system permease subunit